MQQRRWKETKGIAPEAIVLQRHYQETTYAPNEQAGLGIGWEDASLRELAGVWLRLTPSVRATIMEMARNGTVSGQELEAG